MTTRSTFTRAALAVALLVLAGILVWVGATRAENGTAGGILSLVSALLALVAAAFLFIRRGIGATLAIVAGLLGALFALVLSVCFLCSPQPPLSAEAIALFVAAVVILALAVVELKTLGLAWVAIAIGVAVLAFSGTLGMLVAGLVVAAVVARWVLRRRRSGSGVSADGR